MFLRTGSRYFQLDFCRGVREECRFGLAGHCGLIEDLTDFVCGFDFVELIGEDQKVSHHRKLKMEISGCPNACSQPQIKDVGIIAERMPGEIRQSCSRCGKCVSVCREEAVAGTESMPVIDRARCVGCGLCVNRCLEKAIAPGSLRYRILAGGRMGRHPRFAEYLCTIEKDSLVSFIGGILVFTKQYMPEKWRFADLIERNGLKEFKESISNVQVK